MYPSFRSVVFILLMLFPFFASAQDEILRKDGSSTKAIVLEIGKTEVVYKDWNDPEMQTQSIPKSELSGVRYADGKFVDLTKKLGAYSYVAIGGGLWNPFSDWANSSAGNSASGFALTGYNLRLDGSFYFMKWLGINAFAGLGSNGTNGDALSSEVFSSYTNTTEESYKIVGANSSMHFGIGPTFTKRFGQRFQASFIPRFTYQVTELSSIVYQVSGRDASFNIVQLADTEINGSAKGSGIDLGLQFAWRFNRLLTKVDLGLHSVNTLYEMEEIDYLSGTNQFYDYTGIIGNAYVNLSLGYAFGK
jgi:hypothetical protein